jgi:hypothetical protein
MIVNKLTKDYYIGSASTNRFYSRFSNHVIYFRGSKIVKLAIKKYDIKNFALVPHQKSKIFEADVGWEGYYIRSIS